MDKKQIIMWVAILGGGYLIYKYLVDSGILGNLFTPVLAGGGDGGTDAAGQVGTHVDAESRARLDAESRARNSNPTNSTQPPTAGTQPGHNPHTPDSMVDLTVAEKVNQAAGPGAMLSADAWNWHWSNQSGKPQTMDLFPPENRGQLMSIKEYISRRTAAGLSGLGYMMNAFDTPNAWVV